MKLQFVISRKQSDAGTTKSRSASPRRNAGLRFTTFLYGKSQFQEITFLERIDNWVCQSWLNGARLLKDYTSELPGVYPYEIILSLRRLCESGGIPEEDVLATELDGASVPIIQNKVVPKELRFIEHPLDFEWRFSRQAVVKLCDAIRSLKLRRGSTILCLGCPSVFLFGANHLQDLKFQLYDKNIDKAGQLAEAREISHLDLHQTNLPALSASVVVIDPPWYSQFYDLFIWAAFNALPKSGYLFLSFPPKGTRPSAEAEFGELVRKCSLLGLELLSKKECFLPYRAPMFEVNALKVRGISNFSLNWRRGDFAVFIKRKENTVAKPIIYLPEQDWVEMKLENFRIKINRVKRAGKSIFKNAGALEISPSVSSKHSDREKANIVTGGNRYFRSNNPEEVIAAITSLKGTAKGHRNNGFRRSPKPFLLSRLTDLIMQEQTEADQYFRRIHEF